MLTRARRHVQEKANAQSQSGRGLAEIAQKRACPTEEDEEEEDRVPHEVPKVVTTMRASVRKPFAVQTAGARLHPEVSRSEGATM